MGFVIFLFMALILVGALWFVAKLDKAALMFVGAGLFVAMAGYAWQAHPGYRGVPKREAAEQRRADTAFATLRPEMLGRFNSGARWLGLAEMYQRGGDTFRAAQILQSGLRAEPRNSGLWIGYGMALVQHSGGMMTPAARAAFDRAERLAPGHPATRFFYGLALAEGGQLEEAERLWTEVLRTAPDEASWRPMVAQRLDMLRAFRAQVEAAQRAAGQARPAQPQGAPADQAPAPRPRAQP